MELLWDPRTEAMSKVSKVENEPEMSEFESAFLCGLIKTNKPKKILEIGVAAGGTTAIILQCLSDLNMHDCEFISADLNEKYYRGGGKDTGFLGTEIIPQLNNVSHRFVLGHVIAETIESIGGNIDLVILDTVHFLPGEVLDFPVLLPFLSKDAIVVLHDVAYHQFSDREGMATQVLLDVSTGEKILPMGMDETQPFKMPNIGAVRINEDTKKYVEAVFHSMTLPWNYMPDENILNTYRAFYEKYYDKNLVEIFDVAVQLNKRLINKKLHERKNLHDRIYLSARMLLKGR